jgi:hypothetical protein
MSIALTVAAFGVSYAILRWPPAVPAPPTAEVYFWWARPGEAPGWLPPPTARPFVPEPSKALPALAFMTGAPAGIVALVALLVWTASFNKLYVFDAAAMGAAHLRVDGVDVAERDISRDVKADGTVGSLTFRSGEDHRVEVVHPDGTVQGPFTLSGDHSRGWMITVDAPGKEQCFAEFETIYGASSRPPGAKALEPKEPGLFVLERTYDVLFADPPKTEQVKAGHSVSKWALRTIPCEEAAGL